ncbi:MAG: sugar ABC transporter substrate-binding protein [bacterium]|nr:sugar ABC transporter substrate-binding protein [bacterium]MCY3951445.1 sugar ABC transporter substrate-binding protein [bacterium]MCY4104160.1 sugar ABC transporter substrate-binding protein [bacterium]
MRARSLLLSLFVIVLVAAACGEDDDAAAPAPAPAEAPAPPPPEPPPEPPPAPDSGVPTPNNGEQFVVAWTPYSDPTNDLNVAFDNQVKNVIEGAGMKHVYCSGKAEATAQANCIDQFIAQDVDIILIYPADVDSMAETIKVANAAGTPVASFFGNIPDVGQEQLYTLTIPVYDAGVLNGHKLVEYLTEKNGGPQGTVLEITGLMTTSQAQDRNAGFHSVVDEYPDIEVTIRNGDYDTAKAGTITTDWFTANPDTDAIYIHSNCDYTPSVRSALEALDLYVPKDDPGHIGIFGTDGCNSSLHEVRCGFQDYGTTYPTDLAGSQMAEIAVHYLQTGESPQPGEVLNIPGLEGGTTAMVDGSAGPIYFMELFEYTQDTANDPTLFGNSFMSEPNGLTSCDDR